jgi:hypothetical protein
MSKKKVLSRRGRRPSLKVAAHKASRIQGYLKSLTEDVADLEQRLLRLDNLLEASRKAEAQRKKANRRPRTAGIRGKGPNVRDVAHEILVKRRKPMGIQELADAVLKKKPGYAGAHFTQNLGAALAKDARFKRVGRGTYSARK